MFEVIILALLGLCLGSFVNALVWRLRQQEKPDKPKAAGKLSIVKGRSVCPDCRHVLSALDLVPVLSWLILKGKCRYCKKPISWQYPAVELATAGLVLVSYIFWPLGFEVAGMLQFVAWVVLLSGFVALAVYDIRWMILPDKIVYPLIGVAALTTIALALLEGSFSPIINSLIGLLAIGGLFYVLFQISGGKWIGGGDVKLGFLAGLLAGGLLPSLLLLFLASIAGSLFSVPLLLVKKLNRKSRVPFGPFLIIATIAVYLFGSALIDWYKGLLLL